MTTPTKAENPSAELVIELQRRITLAKAMDGRVSLSVVEATTLCALLAQWSKQP